MNGLKEVIENQHSENVTLRQVVVRLQMEKQILLKDNAGKVDELKKQIEILADKNDKLVTDNHKLQKELKNAE